MGADLGAEMLLKRIKGESTSTIPVLVFPLLQIPSFLRASCRPSTEKEVFTMDTQVFPNIPWKRWAFF